MTVDLDRLRPVGLEFLLDAAALQTRIDRKYVLADDDLVGALARLPGSLRVLEIVTPVLGLVAAKVLTEAGLFLASYAVQSRLVFATPVTVPELATASTTATSGSGALPSPARGRRDPGSRTSR
jgi:hypothetical protein